MFAALPGLEIHSQPYKHKEKQNQTSTTQAAVERQDFGLNLDYRSVTSVFNRQQLGINARVCF